MFAIDSEDDGGACLRKEAFKGDRNDLKFVGTCALLGFCVRITCASGGILKLAEEDGLLNR